MLIADEIKIETDEDGFHLLITDTRIGCFNFNIHSQAVALLRETLREIGPWIEEGQSLLTEIGQLR